MALDESEVLRIAHLARLQLDPADTERMGAELGQILEFVEQMNVVDVAEVAPMAHPLDATQRLRPDAVTETDQRERYQAIAPAVAGGLYLVPKVIE
jgi:aspartyl-tRNA(Asn)/glutamyl-tRNA(Gln) amidotransferase subunit C